MNGGICPCLTCGRDFADVDTFLKHRFGKVGVDRRCGSDDEIAAHGLAKSDRGVWVEMQTLVPEAA